jgi:hypothetical protein
LLEDAFTHARDDSKQERQHDDRNDETEYSRHQTDLQTAAHRQVVSRAPLIEVDGCESAGGNRDELPE